MRISTAIASFGMSGQVFHAPFINLHSGFDLSIICERTKNLAKAKYPQVKIVRSFDEILNDASIQLVIVNTPDETHFDYCRRALLAKKNVVVEKPFTQTVAEAEQLIALANENNVLLSVYQNRRWDNDFLTVQKLINENMLGDIIEFESHFDRYRTFIQDSWKEERGFGMGTLYNLGPHLIDQALTLFGMPKSVFGVLDIVRENGKTDDYYEIKFFYDKLKVTLKSSYLVKENSLRFVVHGTNGSFIKHGVDPQEDELKKGATPDKANWGVENPAMSGKVNTNYNGKDLVTNVISEAGNYMAYYDNIYQAIAQQSPLLVTAQDGLNVMKIIELVQQSNRERRIVDVG